MEQYEKSLEDIIAAKKKQQPKKAPLKKKATPQKGLKVTSSKVGAGVKKKGGKGGNNVASKPLVVTVNVPKNGRRSRGPRVQVSCIVSGPERS